MHAAEGPDVESAAGVGALCTAQGAATWSHRSSWNLAGCGATAVEHPVLGG